MGDTGQKIIRRDIRHLLLGIFLRTSPNTSCIVLVNNPTKGLYYGNRVAGPVFLEIAEKFYAKNFMIDLAEVEVQDHVPVSLNGYCEDLVKVASNLSIPIEDKVSDSEWIQTKAANEAIEVKRLAIAKDRVPNVRWNGHDGCNPFA